MLENNDDDDTFWLNINTPNKSSIVTFLNESNLFQSDDILGMERIHRIHRMSAIILFSGLSRFLTIPNRKEVSLHATTQSSFH